MVMITRYASLRPIRAEEFALRSTESSGAACAAAPGCLAEGGGTDISACGAATG